MPRRSSWPPAWKEAYEWLSMIGYQFYNTVGWTEQDGREGLSAAATSWSREQNCTTAFDTHVIDASHGSAPSKRIGTLTLTLSRHCWICTPDGLGGGWKLACGCQLSSILPLAVNYVKYY